MSNFNLFGSDHPRARKAHSCWCCGETINVGDRYFKTIGTLDGKIFSVKHCRVTCECTAEMLDQNPQLRPAVFHPTVATWEALQ